MQHGGWMTGMALGRNCILIEGPLNLPVFSWKSRGNVFLSAYMLSSVSAWVCPPEMMPVVGAGVFFNCEM